MFSTVSVLSFDPIRVRELCVEELKLGCISSGVAVIYRRPLANEFTHVLTPKMGKFYYGHLCNRTKQLSHHMSKLANEIIIERWKMFTHPPISTTITVGVFYYNNQFPVIKM